MSENSGYESTSVTRTASILFAVTDCDNGERHTIYRCDECKALLDGMADARAHLWWHDKLLLVK